MIKKLEIQRKDRWIFCGLDVTEFLNANPETKNQNCKLLRVYPGIALLFIYGVLKVLHLYLVQKKSHISSDHHNHFVLETGESHMSLNYFRFYNPEKSISFQGIKVFDKTSFTAISWISLSELMQTLARNLKDFKKNVEYLPPAFFNLLFRKAVGSISAYTYWCALFKKININNPSAKVFSSGQYISGCAAAAVGMEIIYIAHGLVEYFFANPAYSSVMVYSDEERLNYQKYLDHEQVTLFPITEINDLNQSILIFLASDDSDMVKGDLLGLVAFFHNKNYKIIVKTHPYNSESNVLKKLLEIYKVETCNIKELSGMDALKIYKPKFTAGWVSTSACESLRSGIISITLAEITHRYIQRSVYPMGKRNFFWDTEKSEIEHATLDKKNYFESLELIRFR